VRRSVAGQARGLVRLGIGHTRFDAFLHEQAPDLLVWEVPDDLFDIHPAIAKRQTFAVRLGDLRLEGDDAFLAWLAIAHPHANLSVESRGHGAQSDADPGRRDWARVDRSHASRARGDRSRFWLGRTARRQRRHGPV